MTRSPAWTPAENAAIVRLYFAMLDAATTGQPYNKAAMIRIAQTGGGSVTQPRPLQMRSKQSIEFKLMNCSAAHASLDPNAETMHSHGYRAMPNYQADLKIAMAAALADREFADDCRSLEA